MALVAVPSVAKSFVEERKPYVALLMLAVGAGLLIFGMMTAPGGPSMARVPLAVVEVLAWVFN
jgi:hypothetical protein